MRKYFQLSLIFLIIALLLASCNLPLGKNTAAKTGNEQTAVAQTVSAMQTLLASNFTPVASAAPTATLGSITPTVSDTQTSPQPENTPATLLQSGIHHRCNHPG